MGQGMPIKKIEKQLKISIQTSFDWRHKILGSLGQFTPNESASEVECDELELALSNKGSKSLERNPRKRGTDFKRGQGADQITTVQVVTAVQRNGEKFLKAVASKRLSKEEIIKALDRKSAYSEILITDKYPSYKAFAKGNPKMKRKVLLAKEHVDKNDKTRNLQKVNQVHSQLRTFLRPFNGVSFKYLQNYLNWYAYVDRIQNSKTAIKQWCIIILLTDQAYHLFELFKQNAVFSRFHP